ncbi:hypothetical protein ACFQY7_44110 [Actinomadura luteofluorescens]|uniref:hypothetical protein n=1 Tax=Actinomadura luteofluorescens TaxID=46163 RepID=UPI0036348B43
MDHERQVEARHHVAQPQHPGVVQVGDDAEQFERRLLLLRPRGQELAHRAVHRLVVRPRPDEVVVGVPERDRLDGRAGRGVVAVHHQHALGVGIQLVRPRQDVGAGVVHHEQRDGLLCPRHLLQRVACLFGRTRALHGERLAQPSREVGEQDMPRTRVVIYDEYDRCHHLYQRNCRWRAGTATARAW